MTLEEFLKIMLPVQEYYRQTLSKPALTIYHQTAQELPADLFESLIRKHIADPEQGKFFPTFSHVISQAGNENDIRARASAEFDKNPCVDGTIKFDAHKETVSMRAERKRRYVDQQVSDWRQSTPMQRLARYSKSIGLSRQNMVLENAS